MQNMSGTQDDDSSTSRTGPGRGIFSWLKWVNDRNH